MTMAFSIDAGGSVEVLPLAFFFVGVQVFVDDDGLWPMPDGSMGGRSHYLRLHDRGLFLLQRRHAFMNALAHRIAGNLLFSELVELLLQLFGNECPLLSLRSCDYRRG